MDKRLEIIFRATWGAVGHGALYHSQVLFILVLVSEASLKTSGTFDFDRRLWQKLLTL